LQGLFATVSLLMFRRYAESGYAKAVWPLLMAACVPCGASAQVSGEKAFGKCDTCHVLKANERDKSGPTLHGLFGAKAASLSRTYRYSPALKASGIVWSDATLDQWLAKPSAMVRGNRMSFGGIGDPEVRKALIAYLKRETR
jgi:cytochrome c